VQRQERAIAIFAFSGHGYADQGQQFLVPTDASHPDESDAVPLEMIEHRLSEAGYTDVVYILVRVPSLVGQPETGVVADWAQCRSLARMLSTGQGCCRTYKTIIADEPARAAPIVDNAQTPDRRPTETVGATSRTLSVRRPPAPEHRRSACRTAKIMATGENMAVVDNAVKGTCLSVFMKTLLEVWNENWGMASSDFLNRVARRYGSVLGGPYPPVMCHYQYGPEVMPLDPPSVYRQRQLPYSARRRRGSVRPGQILQ